MCPRPTPQATASLDVSGVCKAAAEVCKLEQVKNLFEGKLVEGVVTAKNQSFMLVDIGFKSDVKVGCMGV